MPLPNSTEIRHWDSYTDSPPVPAAAALANFRAGRVAEFAAELEPVPAPFAPPTMGPESPDDFSGLGGDGFVQDVFELGSDGGGGTVAPPTPDTEPTPDAPPSAPMASSEPGKFSPVILGGLVIAGILVMSR